MGGAAVANFVSILDRCVRCCDDERFHPLVLREADGKVSPGSSASNGGAAAGDVTVAVEYRPQLQGRMILRGSAAWCAIPHVPGVDFAGTSSIRTHRISSRRRWC